MMVHFKCYWSLTDRLTDEQTDRPDSLTDSLIDQLIFLNREKNMMVARQMFGAVALFSMLF